MLLALSTMSPTAQAVLFVLAVVCFALAAVGAARLPAVDFIALGLLFFVVVFAWNALALS